MNNSSLLKSVPYDYRKPVDHQKAIAEFFSWYHLNDAKQIIWEMARAALCSEDYEDSKMRMQAVWMAEHLTGLIEALHEWHVKE
jgi:hypothetical protein